MKKWLLIFIVGIMSVSSAQAERTRIDPCEHSEPRSYPGVEQARFWCLYIRKYLFLNRGDKVRSQEVYFFQGVRMH